MTKHSKVGNAVELVTYEKTECNAKLAVDSWIVADVAL
jgi:hypothetical protein